MHLYGGSGKHSKKKPEKGKKYEEYDYDAGYGEDYDYEDYDYEPAPRQSHSRNAGQTRKTEPKPRRSEPQRRSRRRDSEDKRSTNRTVYGGNGYDYEDDLHFASDAYISREEQRRNKHRGRGALINNGVCNLLTGMGIVVGIPAFRVGAFQIQNHGALPVNPGGSGVRIAGLVDLPIYHHQIRVVNAV